MASAQAQPNIWAQMSYTPPRGSCSQKTSMVTSCSCHRFMIHPLKAATSYDCDGCGHHASFHRLSNPEEEAIIARWKNSGGVADRPDRDNGLEKAMEDYVARGLGPNRRHLQAKSRDMETLRNNLLEGFDATVDRSKRRRIEAAPKGRDESVLELLDDDEVEERLGAPVAKTRKRKGRAESVLELLDDDEVEDRLGAPVAKTRKRKGRGAT